MALACLHGPKSLVEDVAHSLQRSFVTVLQESEFRILWLPLESNPDAFNSFMSKLGMGPEFSFCDVWGLDPELLAMMPQPCIAVMLLFPIDKASEDYAAKEKEKIDKEGQTVSPKVWYMKQTIGNACGTVGLFHAIGNNLDRISLAEGSYLEKYFEESKSIPEDGRCAKLEADDGITAAHEEAARDGQTDAPSLEERVNLHFICFTVVDGHLYELDGRKHAPINHGSTTQDTFLSDAAAQCKAFMARNPGDVNFSLTALCGNA